ncbi:MAG TPA: glycoside hydrolase family 2 TIM barrel-domain containing protein [Acidimicrobiales bacterium]|nr:glycoside hydrolase family 2 TIM barrel-domain containing protein [Acidimicrobiales bacterium]
MSEAAGSGTATGARSYLSLNTGWLFGGKYEPGTEAQGSATSGWTSVNVPHCVVPLSWRNWSPETWQDRWIYRRAVDVPEDIGGQEVFLDFEGSMTSTTPFVNGTALPEAKGGYLPFSYDVTKLVRPGVNELAVIVDGTWQPVPPDGKQPTGAENPAATIDFLEPAGLYRDVGLRFVPTPAHLADVFVDPSAPATGPVTVSVIATVNTTAAVDGYRLSATLRAWGSPLALARAESDLSAPAAGQSQVTISLGNVPGILRWSPSQCQLYCVDVRLIGTNGVEDMLSSRTGFRQAEFRPEGFFLNGDRLLLFGLNRHQIFPYVGMAMSDRGQRRDAHILKNELNCNAVRCSHYPQSRAFLDACDELGMIVWQETPGWGYIGGENWQELWFGNVSAMVARDRSRPSVVVWGVQPNESRPTEAQGTKAKGLAQAADPGRPSSGSNSRYDWQDYVQDVLAYDDYNFLPAKGSGPNVVPKLAPPVRGKPYLVTESVGAIEGVHIFRRSIDQADQQAQARMHGQAHSQAQNPALTYSGLLGWCAFDYASLAAPGWGGIKTPGVADMFRILKPGAAIYQSQVDPQVAPVIQLAFYWDFSPTSPVTSLGANALVFSNCERLEMFLDSVPVGTLVPASKFTYLRWPPFYLDTTLVPAGTQPDLRLDGYVGDQLVLSRNFAGSTSGDRLSVQADDGVIMADGCDATRVWFSAVDSYGAPRPYVTGQVEVSLTGPGALVGDTSFDLDATGGVGAVWLRSVLGVTGQATIQVKHATLGQAEASVVVGAKQKSTVNLEEDMFVRNPSTGEVCLCGPSGAVNLGTDWPAIQAAYAAAGAAVPLVESAELQERFLNIASH